MYPKSPSPICLVETISFSRACLRSICVNCGVAYGLYACRVQRAVGLKRRRRGAKEKRACLPQKAKHRGFGFRGGVGRAFGLQPNGRRSDFTLRHGGPLDEFQFGQRFRRGRFLICGFCFRRGVNRRQCARTRVGVEPLHHGGRGFVRPLHGLNAPQNGSIFLPSFP